MKKISIFFVLALLVSSPVWALNCKVSQSGNSDECWTEVRVSPLETTLPVSVGTVLVYDVSAGPLTDNDGGAYQVRVLGSSNTSRDAYKVAGIAQRFIATGDKGFIMVRGKGKVRVTSGYSSGDRLYVAIDGDMRGALGLRPAGFLGTGDTSSWDKVIAFALDTQTDTNGYTSGDAYITVI